LGATHEKRKAAIPVISTTAGLEKETVTCR
jgi:hypothetical protein